MAKKKYKVVDLTEGRNFVGYADTLKEVKKLAKHWCEEVAEDAAIFYYPLNEETGKYEFSKKIFLESY